MTTARNANLPFRLAAHKLHLVEVLIVLTVITLLAALYLPTYMKRVRSSERIVCIAQLMQTGLGIQQYSSEMYFNHWMNAAKSSADIKRDTPQKLLEDMNLLWGGGKGIVCDSSLFRCRVFTGDGMQRDKWAPTGMPLNATPGRPTVDYGLTAEGSATDAANKVIVSDLPGGPMRYGKRGDFWAGNHTKRSSSIATSDQTCLFMDSHVKVYIGSDIPDDADTYPGDTGSIYCGATPTTVTPGSTTDTLIFNTDDASIRP